MTSDSEVGRGQGSEVCGGGCGGGGVARYTDNQHWAGDTPGRQHHHCKVSTGASQYRARQ